MIQNVPHACIVDKVNSLHQANDVLGMRFPVSILLLTLRFLTLIAPAFYKVNYKKESIFFLPEKIYQFT